MSITWSQIKHLRFKSYLSSATLELLKEQVFRTLRDQEKDNLFEQFMKWKGKDNEIMLYADYSIIDFKLPCTFDSLTQVEFKKNITKVKVVVPFSILNGWAAINKIERGHKHVCLLQFEQEIPQIIKDLPEVNSKNTSTVNDVILYNAADIPNTSSG